MKLGPFEFRFSGDSGLVPLKNDLGPVTTRSGAHVTPDLDRAGTNRVAPFGATGTINYQGYLQPSDYNPDLQRRAAIEVYERMRRSDPSVRETLWHIIAPILNANWTIEPPEQPSDQEREITAFVRAAFFEWMPQPWTEMLTHVLTMLAFGHAVLETQWHAVERSLTVRKPMQTESGAETDETGIDNTSIPTDESIEASTLPPVGKPASLIQVPIPLPPETEATVLPPRLFTTWRRLSPRLPLTIWKWNVDEFDELVSITQTVWVTQADGSQGYRVLDIPAENLIVFTNEKWGDEWTGTSLLRAAYKPWIFKEMIEKIAGIAYERHGVGIPVAYIPRDKAEDDVLADKIERMLATMKSGESSYLVFPGPKQSGSNQNGYLLEILSPTGGIPNFEPILQYFRGEIKGAMLARFSELGHAATGARATADVQSSVWYNALHALARYIEDVFDVAIRRLVDLNYPNVERYPSLMAVGIEARNMLEFAQSVALLAEASMLSSDGGTRQWVRAGIDAPREDEAEFRARLIYESQMAQAQSPLVDPAAGGSGVETKTRGTETKNPGETARPRASNA